MSSFQQVSEWKQDGQGVNVMWHIHTAFLSLVLIQWDDTELRTDEGEICVSRYEGLS